MVIKVTIEDNTIGAEVTVRVPEVLDAMCVALPMLLGQTRPMSSKEVVWTIPLLLFSLVRSPHLMAEGGKLYATTGDEVGNTVGSAQILKVVQGFLGVVDVSSRAVQEVLYGET